MAATRRRWAAAAGAVLALLAAAAPASAASTARAQNTSAQLVSTARWAVVVVPGTSPATGAAPPAAFSTSLTSPTYLTLTNTGTVVPGTMTFTGSVGLSLLGTVESCSQPWSAGLCPGVRRTLTSAVYTAGGSPGPPVPGESWYLKVTALVALGVTMSVVTTAPAPRTVNS